MFPPNGEFAGFCCFSEGFGYLLFHAWKFWSKNPPFGASVGQSVAREEDDKEDEEDKEEEKKDENKHEEEKDKDEDGGQG